MLIKELVPSVDPQNLQEAVIRQFLKEAPATPSMEAVKVALLGRPVALSQIIGHTSVEELIADGVFLNSEVSISAEYIVPSISIMQVRSMMEFMTADFDLMHCLNHLILQNGANFQQKDLQVFHENWEVMIGRLASVSSIASICFNVIIHFSQVKSIAMIMHASAVHPSIRNVLEFFCGNLGQPSCHCIRATVQFPPGLPCCGNGWS